MKKSELRQLIKEELNKSLQEENQNNTIGYILLYNDTPSKIIIPIDDRSSLQMSINYNLKRAGYELEEVGAIIINPPTSDLLYGSENLIKRTINKIDTNKIILDSSLKPIKDFNPNNFTIKPASITW
jgi:CO dehydrogenase/acetyl-CoA synthase beta subunit